MIGNRIMLIVNSMVMKKKRNSRKTSRAYHGLTEEELQSDIEDGILVE
jgi:hypothetical protein